MKIIGRRGGGWGGGVMIKIVGSKRSPVLQCQKNGDDNDTDTDKTVMVTTMARNGDKDAP